MQDRSDLELALAPAATSAPRPVSEITMPPVNPMAAQSFNPMPHGEAAQQDSTITPGPIDQTRQLKPEELAFAHLGPGYFGHYVSSPYEDGSRVVWANGVRRKL